MGHGAWGMGHGAWGMGHWALGIGHGAYLTTLENRYSVLDTPQPKGVGILASSVLSRIIANPLKGYVHKRTLPARPHLK